MTTNNVQYAIPDSPLEAAAYYREQGVRVRSSYPFGSYDVDIMQYRALDIEYRELKASVHDMHIHFLMKEHLQELKGKFVAWIFALELVAAFTALLIYG